MDSPAAVAEDEPLRQAVFSDLSQPTDCVTDSPRTRMRRSAGPTSSCNQRANCGVPVVPPRTKCRLHAWRRAQCFS